MSSPGAAPPKRNPFKQEIADGEAAKEEQIKVRKEGGKSVARAIQKDIKEIFLNDAFDEESADPDSQFRGYDADTPLDYPYITQGEDKLRTLSQERSQEIQKQKLNEVSGKLAELAGSDLSLADKLEKVLLIQGDSVFYLGQYESNWGHLYWVKKINQESLERLLRNLERTALLHAQGAE